MKVVLLGHRIAYSASPAMQSAAFAATGLEGWSYELRDVPESGLAAAVDELRSDAFAGANVTIPHKIRVMELLDEIDRVARRAGAVNTIVRDAASGRLRGTNTDVDGIRAAAAEVGFTGGDVLVLGAGGAARAVGPALGPDATITHVARDVTRAAGLDRVLRWDGDEWRRLAPRAALLVNATPLGRHGELAVAADLLPEDGAVIDLAYAAGGTPLVRVARERGLPTADGWTVLVEQGAAAFERWTGREAPRAAMRAALPA